VTDRQQVTDHRESPAHPLYVPVRGIIDTTKVDQFFEGQLGLITERLHHDKIVGGINLDGHFTERLLQGLHSIAEMLLQVVTKRFQLGGHGSLSVGFVQRAMVFVRRILFCN
jgi:hypothetical protein